MKRVLVGTALLTCLAVPALAAPTLWQGDLFITAVNNAAACDAVGMHVADFARFHFRPKNNASVTSNGPSDLLSWNFQRSSGQLAPNGGVLEGATAAMVRSISPSAVFSQLTNSPIVVARLKPPAPTATTATVLVTITINNIFSSSNSAPSGCNPTFSGALTRRPASP